MWIHPAFMTRDNWACPRVITFQNIKYLLFPFTPLVPARLRAKFAICECLVHSCIYSFILGCRSRDNYACSIYELDLPKLCFWRWCKIKQQGDALRSLQINAILPFMTSQNNTLTDVCDVFFQKPDHIRSKKVHIKVFNSDR